MKTFLSSIKVIRARYFIHFIALFLFSSHIATAQFMEGFENPSCSIGSNGLIGNAFNPSPNVCANNGYGSLGTADLGEHFYNYQNSTFSILNAAEGDYFAMMATKVVFGTTQSEAIVLDYNFIPGKSYEICFQYRLTTSANVIAPITGNIYVTTGYNYNLNASGPEPITNLNIPSSSTLIYNESGLNDLNWTTVTTQPFTAQNNQDQLLFVPSANSTPSGSTIYWAIDKVIIKECDCQVKADFSYCVDDCEYCFTSDIKTNTCTNASYLWDFGDGNTSTDANPCHTYTSSGPKQISLVVTGSAGNTQCIASKTVDVVIDEACEEDSCNCSINTGNLRVKDAVTPCFYNFSVDNVTYSTDCGPNITVSTAWNITCQSSNCQGINLSFNTSGTTANNITLISGTYTVTAVITATNNQNPECYATTTVSHLFSVENNCGIPDPRRVKSGGEFSSKNDLGLNIFPNPSNDFVTISLEGEEMESALIQIVNIEGKIVATENMNGKTTTLIDVNDLKPGVYTFILSDKYGHQTKQNFVKSK